MKKRRIMGGAVSGSQCALMQECLAGDYADRLPRAHLYRARVGQHRCDGRAVVGGDGG